MFISLLADGLRDGLFWLPFVLGVGLLYKNMKTIDISIDGIAVVSIIAFVATWRWMQTPSRESLFWMSLVVAALASICCATLCYMLLYVFIHKLKINAIFAGIIFSFILYAISVIAIGESLSLSTVDNYKFFTRIESVLPWLSLPIAAGVAFFFRTKLGLSIRAVGENEKANGTFSKQKLLLRGFVISGMLVGYGAFCYAVKEDCARSGGGFDFVINSLSSFLLVDRIIDYFIWLYKKNKSEEEIIKSYYFIAFMQNAVVKAVIGSVLFQTLSVIIIHYTDIPVLWKLFLGLALMVVVARIEIRKKDRHIKVHDSTNRVKMEDVTFSYLSGHEKKTVFEGISVEFTKGINIIRGQNGIGKTTLLRLINNELVSEKGTIKIESESNNVFYLRQNAATGCAEEMTVYENVINVLPKIRKGSVVSVNKLISIVNEKVTSYGLDFDFLSDHGIWVKQMGQLSGGQIQKISCLMALLSDCGIVLADEPTSGLDDNNVALMKRFFYKLKELGKNIIIVSHDGRIFEWDAKQYRMTKNKLKEMIKCLDYNWFTEDYGFFGDFYYISDNSNEGPYKGQNISRDERTRNEVAMICGMLGVESGHRLFDCPCGWGRHTIELAKKGIEVTAIDINRRYLGQLKESLDKEDDKVKALVTVERSDMRHVVGQGLFDFGINMFSSFGFFDDEENLSVAKMFCDMLKPGGKMLIHLDFNAERLEKGFVSDYAAERNIQYKGKTYLLKVDKEYHEDDKRLHGLWKLVCDDGKVIEKMYSFRIYSQEEMRVLLMKAGFRKVSFYSTSQEEQTFEDIDTVIVAEK